MVFYDLRRIGLVRCVRRHTPAMTGFKQILRGAALAAALLPATALAGGGWIDGWRYRLEWPWRRRTGLTRHQRGRHGAMRGHPSWTGNWRRPGRSGHGLG